MNAKATNKKRRSSGFGKPKKSKADRRAEKEAKKAERESKEAAAEAKIVKVKDL